MTDDDISIRDYIETMLRLHDEMHTRQHAELERRLEGLNELRKDVITDRGLYATRELVSGLVDAAAERSVAAADKADGLAKALEEKTAQLADAVDERIKPLENNLISQTSLNAYKKALYAAVAAAALAFGLALFNLATRAGGG